MGFNHVITGEALHHAMSSPLSLRCNTRGSTGWVHGRSLGPDRRPSTRIREVIPLLSACIGRSSTRPTHWPHTVTTVQGTQFFFHGLGIFISRPLILRRGIHFGLIRHRPDRLSSLVTVKLCTSTFLRALIPIVRHLYISSLKRNFWSFPICS